MTECVLQVQYVHHVSMFYVLLCVTHNFLMPALCLWALLTELKLMMMKIFAKPEYIEIGIAIKHRSIILAAESDTKTNFK